MAKPVIHAESSVKKYGGKVEDYMPIHQFMDASKGTVADSRHRALTHTSWFLSVVLERVFGITFVNSDGRVISVRDIGEQHVLEDFGGKYIPTVQDFFEGMGVRDWMVNGHGDPPPSFRFARLDQADRKKKKEEVKSDKPVPTAAIKLRNMVID